MDLSEGALDRDLASVDLIRADRDAFLRRGDPVQQDGPAIFGEPDASFGHEGHPGGIHDQVETLRRDITQLM